MPGIHDTVAIAGPDGYARAKTTFAPRSMPGLFDAATVADLEAQVADGAVYFVDATGVVRRLDPGGSAGIVATFPINTARQVITFAMRPDGKQLMAAILTFPTLTPGPNGNPPTASGPWVLQIEEANAGGTTTMLHRWQSATGQYPNGPGGFSNIWVVGWDATGPIGLVGQNMGTQNAWLSNQRYFGGHLARLNGDGTPGVAIGPQDCLPYWRPSGDRYVCTVDSGSTIVVKVIGLDGTVQSNQEVSATCPSQMLGDFVLSPDGLHVATDGQVVALSNGSELRIACGFQPEAWLDSSTLVGQLAMPGGAAPHVAVLHLGDPMHPDDWGFTGTVVGIVR